MKNGELAQFLSSLYKRGSSAEWKILISWTIPPDETSPVIKRRRSRRKNGRQEYSSVGSSLPRQSYERVTCYVLRSEYMDEHYTTVDVTTGVPSVSGVRTYVRHFTVITSELNALREWYLFASVDGALNVGYPSTCARILTPVLMRLKRVPKRAVSPYRYFKIVTRGSELENVEMRL